MKKPNFARKDAKKKLRFSSKRKIKWRRQKGRDNKIRQKMKGYGQMPDIGFGSPKISRGYVNGQEPILIYNSKDLKGVKPNQTIILAHTSQKNKIEVAKKAKEMNLKIKNLNIKKTIRSEKIKLKEEPKTK